MATGLVTDLVIYDDEYKGGMYEKVAQMTDALNAASAGAIRMIVKEMLGDYQKESFWKKLSGIVHRRDLSSTAAVADTALTQDELISVKLSRRLGPLANAVGSLTRIGADMSEMSFVVGQQFGEEKVADWLNTALYAVVAAIEGVDALNYDATGETTPTLTHSHLVKGLSKMGDRSSRIIAWVMHSAPYFDLVGQAISDKIVNVADMAIYQGTTATMNRPVIVTDSAALKEENSSASSGDDTYDILGLTQDAVMVVQSEDDLLRSEVPTGTEQLILRIQGEYTFNLGVKGFQWDTANGGTNPLAAAIATSTNWDQVMASIKDCAGVRIKVNGS